MYARWNEVEQPPLNDPTNIPMSQMTLRIRREQLARDVINSRAWDNFHATPPTQTSSDNLKKNGRPVYYDMNPQASRTNDVKFRLQSEYMPDPSRPTMQNKDLGVPPPQNQATVPSNKFNANQYTQRLDAGGFDARNMMRELNGVVTEDNRNVVIDIDRQLAERQFYDAWLPAKAATDTASLQAYELLRPKGDSWMNAWAGDGK
jgi:hypothetical protein